MNIKSFLKNTWNGAKENAPVLLAIGGLVAAGVTVYAAVKEAPKAKLAITDARIKKEEEIRAELPAEKKNSEIKVHISTAEKIAIIFKCCWPAIVAAATTVGCTIASQVAAGKKIKAAQMAEDIAQKQLQDYVASSVKKLGEKKADDIAEDAAKSSCEANPPKRDSNGQVIAYGKGDYLFYDRQMNVRFWSTIDKVNRAILECNAEILEGEFVMVDEFYERIDPSIKLPSTAYALGFGARADEIAKNAFIRVTYTSEITEDNEVQIVLSYTVRDRKTGRDYEPEEE